MNPYKYFLIAIFILFSPALFGNVDIKSELTDKVSPDFNLYLYSVSEEVATKTINASVKLYLIDNEPNILKPLTQIKQALFANGFVYHVTLQSNLLIFDIHLPIEKLSDLENVLAKYQSDFRFILSKNGWIDVSILGALNAQRVLGFFHANWQPKAEKSDEKGEVLLNNPSLKNIEYANLNIKEDSFYDLLAFFAYCSDVNNLVKNLRVGLEGASCFQKSLNVDLNDADLAIYKANLYEQLMVAKADGSEYLKHLSIFATTENAALFNRLETWLPGASLEKLSHSYNKIITNQVEPISPESVVSAVLASSDKLVTKKLDLLIDKSNSNIQTFVFTINNLKKVCQSNRCKAMLETNNVQFVKGNPSFLIAKFSELNSQKLQKDFADTVLTEIFNLNPWLSSQDIKILASGKNAYISSYLNRYFDSNLENQKQVFQFLESDKNHSELLVSESHIGSLDWASDVVSRYWLGHELTMACPTAKVQAEILGDFFMEFSHLSIEERQQCFDSVMTFKNNLTEKKFSQAKKSAKNFIHSQVHGVVLNLVFTGYYQLSNPVLLLELQLDKLSFDEYKKYIETVLLKINSAKAHFHSK